MKKRKLGIRFRKQQAREWGWTVPAVEGVEVYDIESGEAFEGITNLTVGFNAQKNKITASLEIFVAAVDSYERPEEHLIPLKE